MTRKTLTPFWSGENSDANHLTKREEGRASEEEKIRAAAEILITSRNVSLIARAGAGGRSLGGGSRDIR